MSPTCYENTGHRPFYSLFIYRHEEKAGRENSSHRINHPRPTNVLYARTHTHTYTPKHSHIVYLYTHHTVVLYILCTFTALFTLQSFCGPYRFLFAYMNAILYRIRTVEYRGNKKYSGRISDIITGTVYTLAVSWMHSELFRWIFVGGTRVRRTDNNTPREIHLFNVSGRK